MVVCNIYSTNFTPYCRFAKSLGIPYIVITDGDYYHDDTEDGDKKFGDLASDEDEGVDFDGIDRLVKMRKSFIDRKYGEDFFDMTFDEQREKFAKIGYFIGEYTFEIDVFNCAKTADKEIICSIFNQLTNGGKQQQKNFKRNMGAGEYYKCLNQIESSYSGIGKGRFAQRLANEATLTMIPRYISDAINKIVCIVRG